MKAKRKKKGPVSLKISKLRHEGVPQDQAVAEAKSMERAGRLTERGGYIRSKRKHRRTNARRR